MNDSRKTNRRFIQRSVGFVAVVVVVVVAVRLSMPWLGRRLIRSDPLKHADVIVVLGSERLERTFEAATLYHEGWAPRILLLRPPDYVRDELRQRFDVSIPVQLDVQKSILAQMHVPPSAVDASPKIQDSTRQEAVNTAEYARQHGYRRMIVVTSPYHTSRAGGLFQNAARGSCEVIVHPDRYETADPNQWWIRYPDRSDVVFEYMKRVYAWIW